MARVDFYVLPEHGGQSRQQFACALTSKAWSAGNSVYVHTVDASEAEQLDKLLWTFRDISFVPHARIDAAEAGSVPVLIGWQDASAEADVMVNLGTEIPPAAAKFARIAEIVAGSDTERQQARERYRQYREAGHELHNHVIGE